MVKLGQHNTRLFSFDNIYHFLRDFLGGASLYWEMSNALEHLETSGTKCFMNLSIVCTYVTGKMRNRWISRFFFYLQQFYAAGLLCFMSVYLSVCIWVWCGVCLCVHVCVFVCLCVLFVYMYVCVCVCCVCAWVEGVWVYICLNGLAHIWGDRADMWDEQLLLSVNNIYTPNFHTTAAVTVGGSDDVCIEHAWACNIFLCTISINSINIF